MGLTVFQITAGVNSVIAFLIGTFVLLKGNQNRKKLNYIFFLFSISVCLYAVFFSLSLYNQNPIAALLQVRIFHVFCFFIATFMYLFVHEFIFENTFEKAWHFVPILIAVLGSYFALFGTIVKGVEPVGIIRNWTVIGDQFFIYLIPYLVLTHGSLVLIWRQFLKEKGAKRVQLKWILISLIIGLGGAWTTFMPAWGIKVEPHGFHFIFLLHFAIGFAIIKHDLMDIRVVITKSLSWLMTVLSLLSIFVLGTLAFVHWGNVQTSVNFILWGSLFITLTALAFERVRLFIQTPLETKFLKGNYDLNSVVKDIASNLYKVQSREEIVQVIGQTFVEKVQIKNIYAVLINDSASEETCSDFKVYMFEPKENKPFDTEIAIKSDDPLIEFLRPYGDVTEWNQLQARIKECLSGLVIGKGSVLVPLHSARYFYGFFIIGPKLSEDSYSDQDRALFSAIVTQIMVIFDRISVNEMLQLKNSELTQLSHHYKSLSEQYKQDKEIALSKAKEISHRAALAGMTLGVSHEIRNPLVSVLNGSEALRLKLVGLEGKDPDPWSLEITPQIFSDIIHNQEEVALFLEWLHSNHYVTDTHLIDIDCPEINPFYGVNSFDLPDAIKPYEKPLMDRFREMFKKTVIITHLEDVEKHCDRVVMISNSMMQYGSTKGVSKKLFLRIKGFDDKMAEDLFSELTSKEYFDPYGGTLEKYKPDDPAFQLDLSEKFQPYSQTIIDLVRTTSNIPKSSLDISDPLGVALKMIKSVYYGKRSVEYDIHCAHTKLVLGESTRLFQVFNILLNNAMEAMLNEPPDKKLSIVIQTEDAPFLSLNGDAINGVMVSIQDTGEGIAKENIEKLRNPFFTTKSPGGGKNSGLGLSILYEVVEKHAGKVEVSSIEGVGTTFRVYIPAG